MTQNISILSDAATQAKANGANHLGDFVSWDTESVSVPRADLRAAFAVAGAQFGALIKDVDPAVALFRAKATLSSGADGLVVKAFRSPAKDTPASIGVSRYMEQPGEEGVSLTLGARVRVAPNGTVVAVGRPDGTYDDDCMLRAQAIAALANHLIGYAVTADLSLAAVNAIRMIGGVPLRKRGGAYFVPAVFTGAWRKLSDAVAQACGAHCTAEAGGACVAWEGGTFEPTILELYDSPRAVATVAAAASSSFEAELSELTGDLRKAREEGFTKRAPLVDRIALCEQLTDRAKLYESVLAGAADEIRASIDAIKAGLELELGAYDAGKRPGKVTAAA